MIRPEDAQFHPPTTEDPLWAETNYFGLYAGQDTGSPINIGVYGLFREPLGVVGSTVAINSKRVTLPWAADYWDAWEHLVVPQPSNLLDYELANGLKVVCSEPNKVWDVDYSDKAAGLELHFRYTALAEPYDINDPEQDPMAARKDMDLTWGHAYAGHFDQTGRFEGELVLRGATHRIDCVSTMDHSWGVRAERQTSRLSWLHAHFSADFVVHGLFDFDTSGGPDAPSALALTHGYVLDHGTLHGLKAGSGTTRRSGLLPRRRRADRHRLRGPDVGAERHRPDHLPVAGVAGNGGAQRLAALDVRRADRVRRVHGLHRPRRARRRVQPGMSGSAAPAARPPVHAVLFDLDGTLVQTRAASWELFSRVSDRYDLGVRDPDQYFDLFRGNIFDSIRGLCRDDAHAAEVKAAFLDLLRGEYTPALVPGMADVVRKLAGTCTLAVMSSNATQVLRRVLVSGDLAFCFAHVFGGDVAPDKAGAIRTFLADRGSAYGRRCSADYDEAGGSPEPGLSSTVLVTDTAGDVREAMQAGIRAVGVAWGMHSVDQLIGAGAEFVALWPQEIGAYLVPEGVVASGACAVVSGAGVSGDSGVAGLAAAGVVRRERRRAAVRAVSGVPGRLDGGVSAAGVSAGGDELLAAVRRICS